jgi:uncharacterized MnhB-related membrane protein
MWHAIVVIGILVCAVQAIRAQRLLVSALWLAGASALTALMLYLLGAYRVAVIELSVGAGLVTVLFVFAINIAGEEAIGLRSILPRPLAWVLIGASVLLLGILILPALNIAPVAENAPGDLFTATFWQDRQLDVLLQIVLIFAGVLGVLGLLSEGKPGSAKEKDA